MLILGRRRGERIIIETADGIITILPVMIDGEQIRIGIEAPGHIAVDREEVYRRKCGVFWHKRARKWQANVRLNGKYRYLGLFDDINEAAAVVSKFYAANGFAKDRLIRWRYRQKQAEQGAEPLLEIWRG